MKHREVFCNTENSLSQRQYKVQNREKEREGGWEGKGERDSLNQYDSYTGLISQTKA